MGEKREREIFVISLCLNWLFFQKLWTIPGNNVCADCHHADPDWVSLNLGFSLFPSLFCSLRRWYVRVWRKWFGGQESWFVWAALGFTVHWVITLRGIWFMQLCFMEIKEGDRMFLIFGWNFLKFARCAYFSSPLPHFGWPGAHTTQHT